MSRERVTIALGVLTALFCQSALGQTKLNAGQWYVQNLQPTHVQGKLSVELIPAYGTFDLYLRKGSAPTLTEYDIKIPAQIGGRGEKPIRVTLTNTSSPKLTSDRWYFGAYARQRGALDLKYSASVIASEFSGKGSTPMSGLTSFRVWAPNATSAHVAGSFNSWSSTSAPMVHEGSGWYSLDIRNVTPGSQYRYVFKNGANTYWRNDAYARQVTNSVGNSVVFDHNAYAWQNNGFITPWWNQVVMMEVHVGTFFDSPGGSPGNFTTALSKLDYLRDLGINAIQLMPIQEFAGDFSWGYNPSQIFAVESAYGGPAGLKRFVDEANQRGIAVLLDLVHNHWGTSDLETWRYDGWYQSTFGGIYFYNDARANTPWGNTRPDFGRGEVRQYIRDNQMEWLEQYRISGFRWDSTLNMRRTDWGDNPDGWSLLQWINNEMDASQPWKINIAEDLQNNEWITKPTSVGGAGFDAQWSNFVHTVRDALITPDDNARDMFAIRGAVTEAFNGDPFERVIYTESHDENANGRQRVPSMIDAGNPSSYWAQKRSTLGASITLTSPGIPMLFQGQEFLEDGWFSDTDPVDWSKATTYAGILQLYKDLIRLRRNLDGQSAGLQGSNLNFFHTNNSAKVIAYHRWLNGGSNDDVVVVANFRNTTYNNYRVGFPRNGGWRVVFNSDWNGYSGLFGNLYSPDITADGPAQDGLAQSGIVNLAPYSVVILSKI